jgi:2,6-dihydroxypyridine 3-monooxygenase
MDGSGKTAAIVGGSLGGLTVANLLQDAGWKVTVHERSRVPPDSRGAGIVVHEATVRYLVERTGINIDTISCPSSYIRYLAPDGSTVHEAPSTYRFTAWNALYRSLLSTVSHHYHLDHSVVRVVEDDHRVTLQLENGNTDTADLVVAADGFDSTVRNQLFGSVERSYSGYVGWRGLISERDLTSETFELLADAITYCVIPNSHIVVYPIPAVEGSVEVGSRLINYVWYRNITAGSELDELMTGTDGERRAVSLPPGLVRQQFINELHAAAADLAPQLAEMVRSTAEPFVQVIVDIASTQMARPRIALLGDGAFSARPHAAAGTAKAAEDGWKLVEALANSDTIPDALQAWEQSQLQLGRSLVVRARLLGSRSQELNTWTPGDPSLAFGLYGPGR